MGHFRCRVLECKLLYLMILHKSWSIVLRTLYLSMSVTECIGICKHPQYGGDTLNVMRMPLRFSSLLSARSAAEPLYGGLAVGLLSIGMICRDLRLLGSSASLPY